MKGHQQGSMNSPRIRGPSVHKTKKQRRNRGFSPISAAAFVLIPVLSLCVLIVALAERYMPNEKHDIDHLLNLAVIDHSPRKNEGNGVVAIPDSFLFERNFDENLSGMPKWIVDYLSWHSEMRAKYPGMSLLEDNPKDPDKPKVLIRVCLGLCGGLHDRLGQLPWDLYLAYKTKRVLMISWQRPRSLEEFLVPSNLTRFDWRVPAQAKFGFKDMHEVRAHRELFEGYLEDRPESDFWSSHVDLTLERANNGEFKNVRILRHRILGHLGEDDLDRRLKIEDPNTPSLHEPILFGKIFWLFFRPSPPVEAMFRSVLNDELKLKPYEFSAVHCRVRHPKATEKSITILGKNPKYPADKTGLPWEGETRQFALNVATKSLKCAMETQKSGQQMPIYFLSDSNDLVEHVAHELNGQQQQQEWWDPELITVVSAVPAVLARNMTEENAHIDRQKGRPAPAYYATFIDLLLAMHARCVVFGIGYYALFAAKISGTTCQGVYEKESWGNHEFTKGTKHTHICQ